MKKDCTTGFCGSRDLKSTQPFGCRDDGCCIHGFGTLSQQLREYPKGLGRALLRIMLDNKILSSPEPVLRQKYDFSSYTDDLSLFASLPMGDTWPDAQLATVYLYLWKNKRVNIPPEWREAMQKFTQELRAVTWHIVLHLRAQVNDPDPFGLNE